MVVCVELVGSTDSSRADFTMSKLLRIAVIAPNGIGVRHGSRNTHVPFVLVHRGAD